MRRVLPVVALPVLVVALTLVFGQGASASFGGSAGCVTLPVTPKLKSTLLRVHRATQNANTRTTGPVGRVYYGRCPKAFYALATFHHKTPAVNFGGQDQPERFQRKIGGVWKDRGDTGGFVCEAAPRALLKLWRLLENC